MSIVTWKWTDRGFFSEFNTYLLAYSFAILSNKEFLILTDKKNDILWDKLFKNKHKKYYLKNMKIEVIGESILMQIFNTLRLSLQLKTFVLIPSVVFENTLNEKYKKYLISKKIIPIEHLNNLFCKIWNLDSGVLSEINANKLRIFENKKDEKYHAIHVRRGDKLDFEATRVSAKRYLEKLNFSTVHNLYVATDDYQGILEIRAELDAMGYQDISILTLTDKNKDGYRQSEFIDLPEQDKRRDIVNLLTDFEILRSSEIFVGSFSSNVSHIAHIARCGKSSYSVDINFDPTHDPYKEHRGRKLFSNITGFFLGP